MSVTAIQEEILGLPAAECARRIDAYDAGKLAARDAADVLADLKKDLGR